MFLNYQNLFKKVFITQVDSLDMEPETCGIRLTDVMHIFVSRFQPEHSHPVFISATWPPSTLCLTMLHGHHVYEEVNKSLCGHPRGGGAQLPRIYSDTSTTSSTELHPAMVRGFSAQAWVDHNDRLTSEFPDNTGPLKRLIVKDQTEPWGLTHCIAGSIFRLQRKSQAR